MRTRKKPMVFSSTQMSGFNTRSKICIIQQKNQECESDVNFSCLYQKLRITIPRLYGAFFGNLFGKLTAAGHCLLGKSAELLLLCYMEEEKSYAFGMT